MCGRRDQSLLLDDMVTAAGRLAELADSIPRDRDPPRDITEMVLWNFTQLGEAARRLPAEVRSRFADVPWSDMVGMRDRIVHGYDDIRWSKAREIAGNSVPAVLPRLIEIRDTLRDDYDAQELPAYYAARRRPEVTQ